VVIHSASKDALYHLSNESGSWRERLIDDGDRDAGQNVSLVIGPNDVLHVIYDRRTSSSNHRLYHASRATSTSNWSVTLVEGPDSDSYRTAAVWAKNALQMVYTRSGELYHRQGASRTLVFSGTNTVLVPAVAADSAGNLHIAHGQGTISTSHYVSTQLDYSTNQSGSWTTTTLHSGMSSGNHPSIVVHSDGSIYISHGGENDSLRLTGRLIVSFKIGGAATFTTATLRSAPAGTHSSIQLNQAGSPLILHHDALNKVLYLETHDGTSWSQQTIDSQGGRWGALLRLASGELHMVYERSDNVVYARMSNCP
jgi:hypothetical protein